jgi:pyrroline-5-carboxylate reductase
MTEKIVIIGCGKMGEALLRGLISKKLFQKKQILISDQRIGRLKTLGKKYNVIISPSNTQAVSSADIILLAVKPQDMGLLLKDLPSVIKDKLIISIAAGVKIGFIKNQTGAKRVVRAMPNIPVLVGAGITALSFAPGMSVSDKTISRRIFDCVGTTVQTKEGHINAVTAVSGSGPAYVFSLMEAMAKAAIALGLDEKISFKLVADTVYGSGLLQHSLARCPASLREDVTSKGGTTEAAMAVFQKKGFEKTVHEAVNAAFARSKKLEEV